uniref:Reticulon n=1 Tax=Callorhinchus milii TaxID=7868 RepID=A0A4W3H9I1_CALMI
MASNPFGQPLAEGESGGRDGERSAAQSRSQSHSHSHSHSHSQTRAQAQAQAAGAGGGGGGDGDGDGDAAAGSWRGGDQPLVPDSRGPPVTKATASAVGHPFLIQNLNTKAIDLLYWRDIKQTGIVFGSVLLLLFSLTQFSVVSVIAYLALAALSATISFRIYKSVLQAVQKTDEGHPFKAYLDMDTNLSEEQIQKYADSALVYVNSTVKELRRLFLVHDLVDSLKFAVLMWLLTYVGALFNGLTLLIMAVVSMFTLPVVYEKYQVSECFGYFRIYTGTDRKLGNFHACPLPGNRDLLKTQPCCRHPDRSVQLWWSR